MMHNFLKHFTKPKVWFIYIVLPIIVVLGLLEVWFRVTLPKHVDTWHAENSNYLHLAKQSIKNYDEHIKSLKQVSYNGFKYYDYHIYALAPIKTATINITDYYSARFVPASVPLKQADEVIWLFGGSTLQNLGAPDEMTIANALTSTLKAKGINAHVRNFGVGGHQSSLELAKFTELLRQVPREEHPTAVVFYDGYNDVWYGLVDGPGKFQGDIQRKIKGLVEDNHEFTWLFTLNNFFHNKSYFWRFRIFPYFYNKIKSKEQVERPKKTHSNDIANVYLNNISMANSICQARKIDCFFVLQPMLSSKLPLNKYEKRLMQQSSPQYIKTYWYFYKQVQVALKNFPKFIDLSAMLNDSSETDFYDYGHTNPQTSVVIGKRLGYELWKQLRLKNN